MGPPLAQRRYELVDRSSAPKRIPANTAPQREEAICSLRKRRMTVAQIAELLGMAHSTVSAVLHRRGLGRLPRLAEPDNRYERPLPGELVHVDVKKLGAIVIPGHRVTGDRTRRARGTAGWEYVPVCVDDCTRLAYVEVLDDERADMVCAFLRRAVEWFGQAASGSAGS